MTKEVGPAFAGGFSGRTSLTLQKQAGWKQFMW